MAEIKDRNEGIDRYRLIETDRGLEERDRTSKAAKTFPKKPNCPNIRVLTISISCTSFFDVMAIYDVKTNTLFFFWIGLD